MNLVKFVLSRVKVFTATSEYLYNVKTTLFQLIHIVRYSHKAFCDTSVHSTKLSAALDARRIFEICFLTISTGRTREVINYITGVM